MNTSDRIALAALVLSVVSAIVAGTAIFTRGALTADELRADIGDPNAPSGLYGQVAGAREKAEGAVATADAAKTASDAARDRSFGASEKSAAAESVATEAKRVAVDALGKIETAQGAAIDAKADAETALSNSKAALTRTVPVGTILAWVPTPDHPRPPKEWSICDGKDGTPDLTDTFLMGTKYPDKAQEPGGSNSIPDDGSHKHGGATGKASESGKPKENGNDGHHMHKHDHSISADGSHSHGGDNRPRFYTVVFIMKTR